MSSEHERGAGAAIPSFVVDGFAKFDDGNLNDMSGYGLTLVTYSKCLFGFVGFRVHPPPTTTMAASCSSQPGSSLPSNHRPFGARERAWSREAESLRCVLW